MDSGIRFFAGLFGCALFRLRQPIPDMVTPVFLILLQQLNHQLHRLYLPGAFLLPLFIDKIRFGLNVLDLSSQNTNRALDRLLVLTSDSMWIG